MSNVHPQLTQSVVEQTPRAMIAMILVSLAYIWIFIPFVPLYLLFVWFCFQILLGLYRFHNSKMLKKYLELENKQEKKKHEMLFLLSNIFQAFMWTTASIFSLLYAPPPYELVTFIMIIGIITAAALSMSSLYTAYLVFFFLMIIPQIFIMFYYGEHYHIGLAVLAFIFIPATMLLSHAIYTSRLSTIKSHDELEKNIEELHKLSITDNLTNIYNRRYFFDVAHKLISIAQREKTPISLLMLDIDHFKNINDTYGHQAGDFILVSMTKDVNNVIRESDIFARIGGEEFTILLHDTHIDGALIIAEKIREKIEHKQYIYNDFTIHVTVSIGVAELNEKLDSVEELYKETDKRLYKAKETGRNRVY